MHPNTPVAPGQNVPDIQKKIERRNAFRAIRAYQRARVIRACVVSGLVGALTAAVIGLTNPGDAQAVGPRTKYWNPNNKSAPSHSLVLTPEVMDAGYGWLVQVHGCNTFKDVDAGEQPRCRNATSPWYIVPQSRWAAIDAFDSQVSALADDKDGI